MARAENPLPDVSYVMPVLNEAAYIENAVRSVLSQDYAGDKEIILALGASTDGTDEVVERMAQADPRIRLVRNPASDIPIGLNLAIRASRHPVVVRVDAHSELEPDYTRQAVETMLRTGAANVGGVMKASGRAPFQSAVARAYNSRFGLGGGAYHSGSVAGPAESAYLGVFRREVLEQVRLYDETLRRGEDWELNLRIRSAGFLVWLDPELKVTYWPRESWGRLVRQFCATGIWRGELVRRYRGRNPWRFFMPPLLVVVLALSALVALGQLTGLLRGGLALAACLVYLGPALYLASLVVVAFLRPRQGGLRDRALFFVVLPTMHISWGMGFIIGLFRGGGSSRDTSRSRVVTR